MRSFKNNNRYSFGAIIITHKGRRIPTSVGARSYESMFCGLQSEHQFINTIGNIPAGYDHRPELISDLWLNNPATWWLICERNNIFDTFEQMNTGDRITIPSR